MTTVVRSILAGALLWTTSVGCVFAADQHAEGTDVAEVTPCGAAPELAAQVGEPAFEHFVDFSAFGESLQSGDATAAVDFALALAEAERVLLRPCAAVTADTALRAALRLSVAKRDQGALDRLSQFAAQRGSPQLKDAVEAAAKLAATTRSPGPRMSLEIGDDAALEQLSLVQGFWRRAETAAMIGARAELQAVLDDIELCALPQEPAEALRGKVKAALEHVATAQPADADVLQKLASASRSKSLGWIGIKQLGTHSYKGDKYLYVAFRYSGHWNKDEVSDAFWPVVRAARDGNYTSPVDVRLEVSRENSPACVGYYNITKKWGSWFLLTGVYRDSNGRCCSSRRLTANGELLPNQHGWTEGRWKAPNTNYWLRVGYADDDRGGLAFYFGKASP